MAVCRASTCFRSDGVLIIENARALSICSNITWMSWDQRSRPYQRHHRLNTESTHNGIPVIFGCPTKISQEGNGQAHVCPRCHNAQVVTGKSRTWFELCWIPLIPMKSKHIYICGICQWQAPQDGQYQPPVAQQPGYAGPPQHGGGPGFFKH